MERAHVHLTLLLYKVQCLVGFSRFSSLSDVYQSSCRVICPQLSAVLAHLLIFLSHTVSVYVFISTEGESVHTHIYTRAYTQPSVERTEKTSPIFST